MLVTGFYFATFLISLIMIGIFLIRNKRVNTLYMLTIFSMLMTTMGHWLLSVSETVEQAIWANKVVYIGGCFAPLLMIVSLAKFCYVEAPKVVTTVVAVLSVINMGFVMTIGHSDLYYKSVELAEADGHHYLIKEYGPAHTMYPVLLVIDGIFLVTLLVKAFMRRKTTPFSSILLFTIVGVGTIAAYGITRVTHSTIEWILIGYLITIVTITYRFDHLNMYDMTANIASAVDNLKEYGFIVFDSKRRYISSNELVRSLFPEINDWKTNHPVEQSDTAAYREIVSWYYGWCDGAREKRIIELDGRFLELSVRDVVYGNRKKKVGDLIEMSDRTAEHKYMSKVESYNAELSAEVAEKTAHINDIKDKMIIGMAALVESRDNSTGGHIRRTSEVVRIFSEELLNNADEFGIDTVFIDMVIKAAPMHDLGKIAVDDAILRKQGRFTPEEYDEMKKHSAEGAKIVSRILVGTEDEAFVKIAENIAHYHHEKWNGKGYPCGLSGADIPIEARIMALADVFDALVSKRCYKEAFSYDKAFEIIENDLGEHFDPALGRAFMYCRPKLEELYDRLKAEE